MYVALGCCPPRRGLGAVPVLGVATSLVTNAIGGFFQSSDPVKDKQRKDRIDSEYAGAMGGNQAAVDCLEAMSRGVANNDGRICAVGSKVAAAYAYAKWMEFKARHAAGLVAGVLIPQSDIPTQVIGTIQRAATNPIVIGAVLVGGYILLARRRSR